MKKNAFKFIFIVCLFVITGIISWNLYFRVYSQIDKVNIHLFPQVIGDWTSEEMPITDEEYAILETKNAFARRYKTSSGKETYLFIVYSESNRKVSHPPEICYTGNGITILNSSRAFIPSADGQQNITTNRLLLEQGRVQQITYYWFKVGDTFTSNYWKQQMLIAIKTLLGQPASSALIRVSITIRPDNKNTAESEIIEFSRLIVPDLFKYLP